jgi:2-polyprenyl-3-methyl-5-hydroxy-6-metoxy-1,4-benzoquinol methylase
MNPSHRDLSRFNAERWGTNLVSPQEPRLQKIAPMVRTHKPGILLDLGCGDGGFSCQFLNDGWTVHGVDLTAEQIQLAQQKGVQAKSCDISKGFDFPDRTLDLITASEVIEHLVDTDFFLDEAWRTLKPGGVLILTTANLASLNNRFRLWLGMYPTFMDYGVREGVGHVRYYTMPILKKQLRDHGFVISRTMGSHVPLMLTRWVMLDGIPRTFLKWGMKLGNIFPNVSMELIVECRKPL